MNTSTTDISKTPQGAALADALTLVRFLLAPIVAGAVIWGWPSVAWACLASFLFALGALTDLLDDMFGGSEKSPARIFGWVDDIADAVLIGAALLAMLYVTNRAGILGWAFLVPAAVYVCRDMLGGLIKGFEFSKIGAPQTRLGDLKNVLAMVGVSLMLASPWLQLLIDRTRARTPEDMMTIFGNASPWIWQIGQGLLWIAAALSVYTALQYFFSKRIANEA